MRRAVINIHTATDRAAYGMYAAAMFITIQTPEANEPCWTVTRERVRAICTDCIGSGQPYINSGDVKRSCGGRECMTYLCVVTARGQIVDTAQHYRCEHTKDGINGIYIANGGDEGKRG